MSDPVRPLPEQLARYAERFNQSQTLRFFGARISFPEGRCVQVDLPVVPAHRGGLGSEAVNGGILAALFDLAIGCTPALVDPTRKSATVQLSLSFMRPVTGEHIKAIGSIDRAGGSMIFSSAVILDGEGRECARCQGLIRFSQQRWADGESPAVN